MSMRMNHRELEYPWYSYWMYHLLDLTNGNPRLIISPQHPVQFSPEALADLKVVATKKIGFRLADLAVVKVKPETAIHFNAITSKWTPRSEGSVEATVETKRFTKNAFSLDPHLREKEVLDRIQEAKGGVLEKAAWVIAGNPYQISVECIVAARTGHALRLNESQSALGSLKSSADWVISELVLVLFTFALRRIY
ncbi:hypothetical protein CONPUDRAFT_142392 [Coniophora puteana RWD-64-598 SS2]|uniref:Uncharacterized protein n=1 Tax=Coniophora puteana (strain RWD-64-598) TaxID=741705 RepID=A0A5M3MYJ2_CONPW|nr:uncharacterized protein CONPUDRAFT_142392 [Coniophora puteana RWD-64-598 SS2]EIW83854.1 hypothetical protein CONPUDRAFT_142392 [Coniophora puteana RWD-64-598 SS2]